MTGCRNSTWRPARAVHHPVFTRLQRKEGSCSAPARGVEPRLRGGSSGKILAQFWKVLSHRAGQWIGLLLGVAQEEKGVAEEMLNGITNSIGMNLSKLRETVKDRETWGAAAHGATESNMTGAAARGAAESDTTGWLNNNFGWVWYTPVTGADQVQDRQHLGRNVVSGTGH